MSPVNSMFVCIRKKKLQPKIIGKYVLKMADIGKMLNIGSDNRSTPTLGHGYYGPLHTACVQGQDTDA